MSVPNRAAEASRVMGDHSTHLIDLHPTMRPYGTSIKTQERNSKTQGYNDPQHAGQFETSSADNVHRVLSGVKDTMQKTGQRGMVHAEVTYHPDDVSSMRSQAAQEIGKQSQYSDSSHSNYIQSGAGRQFAINEAAAKSVPDRATSSFKV